MKQYGLSFLLLLICLFSNAQYSNRFNEDLNALSTYLEQTPSFKDQVTGKKKQAYQALLSTLKKKEFEPGSGFDYFLHLTRLFSLFNDNHLGFYQTARPQLYNDSTAYRSYAAAPDFPVYDDLKINADSLEKRLTGVSPEDAEGIYHFDTLLSIGVFRLKPDEYRGIVLSSRLLCWGLPVWKRGESILHLLKDRQGYFKAVYAHPLTKKLQFQPIEKIRRQTLLNFRFYGFFSGKYLAKEGAVAGRDNLPQSAPDFSFNQPAPGITYMQIRHFSADRIRMQQSQQFYDSVKSKLNDPHLILDIRNHDGGSGKVSQKFLRLLQRYVVRGKLHVLINNGTVSQGEIFVLQLKQSENTIVYGDTTAGKLAYGSNYGKREQLPGGQLELYLTDMRNKKKYRRYENAGVAPDHLLSMDTEWTTQIIRKIKEDMPEKK